MVNRMLRKLFVLAGLCLLPGLSFAQFQPMVPPPGAATLPPLPAPVVTDPSTLISLYEGAAGQWYAGVYPYALEFFAALAFLEVAAFGWSLWRTYHGDVGAATMSTANKILIIGVFLSILLNGEAWATDIIGMFETVGKNASGIPSLTPSAILAQGFNVFGTMFGGAMSASLLGDIPSAIALIPAGLIICFSFLVITFQFVVTKVQTFLALGLGFFFLSFGGSRWTTPYVERYFAYCVASGTKLMGLYALIGVGWSATNAWIVQAKQATSFLSEVEAAWMIMCGAVLYAGICWYGSSQISQILGGSPNLSHSDFVSFMGPMVTAAVSTALIGAGVATAGVGAVAGATAAGAAKAGAAAASASAAGAAPTQTAASAGASVGKAAARGVGQLAQAGASAMSRMPGGGSHTPPPHFNGFGH